MNKKLFPLCLLLLLSLSSTVFAEITIGILPAKGDQEKLIEITQILKKQLHELEGISLVADDVMGKIMEIHKKSMVLGSSYHDIAKLKLAEFIVSLTMQKNNLELVLVDVNSGVEVYRDLLSISSNMKDALRESCGKLRHKLIMHQGNRRSVVPEDARPYFELITNFADSLTKDNEASYPYIAFFHVDKYKHPSKLTPALTQSANILLQVIRPKLIRSKLTYVYMKPKSPLVYITIVAKKIGKTNQVTFSVIELEDGSLGITSYEIKK